MNNTAKPLFVVEIEPGKAGASGDVVQHIGPVDLTRATDFYLFRLIQELHDGTGRWLAERV